MNDLNQESSLNDKPNNKYTLINPYDLLGFDSKNPNMDQMKRGA